MIGVIVETNILEVCQALELKAKRLSKARDDAAKDLANRVHLDFQRTVETWSDPRPKFSKEMEIRGDQITFQIGTEDKIYLFIDKGTRVRYATMTPGFKAKTRPGVLGSGRGNGGVLFISKKHPRPGIEARRFSDTIQEKYDRMADQIAEKYIRQWQQST